MRWGGAGALIVAAVALAACTVDDGFLDADIFECEVASDCGEGWGCARATPYAANFCAPDCDATCDGTCTGGAQPLCLQSCLIGEDGTPGSCQGDGYACIRTSIERDEGVCYPIRSCGTHEDCAVTEVCLTQYLRDLNPDSTAPLDNLYCVPRANDDGQCPVGSRTPPFLPEGATPVCYPTCSVTDTRCPPGMACVTQLHQYSLLSDAIEGPTCALGNYGLSCQDDTNCFVGRCLDTGSAQGSLCTLTCNEASRLAGGCTNLIHPFSLEGLIARLECDPSAPSSDGSGLCVLRYKINFPGCTTEAGSAYECATGLECRTYPTRDGGEVKLCTKSCTTDRECNDGLGENPSNWPWECNELLRICLFPEAN